MSWALFTLGHHPDVQDKIFEEMFEIFGSDSQRMPTLEELKQMRYLEAVIKEALRLYPPVGLYARRVEENFNIGNCMH